MNILNLGSILPWPFSFLASGVLDFWCIIISGGVNIFVLLFVPGPCVCLYKNQKCDVSGFLSTPFLAFSAGINQPSNIPTKAIVYAKAITHISLEKKQLLGTTSHTQQKETNFIYDFYLRTREKPYSISYPKDVQHSFCYCLPGCLYLIFWSFDMSGVSDFRSRFDILPPWKFERLFIFVTNTQLVLVDQWNRTKPLHP